MEFTSIQKIKKDLQNNNQVIPGNYDFTFKRLVRDPKTKDFISYMISKILRLSFNYVRKNLVFRNTELLKETSFEKNKVVDIIADIKDLRLILEMNRNSRDWQNQKSFAYVCKIYNENMQMGDSYENVRPVILIDFNYGCGDNDELITNYKMQVKKGEKVYTEKVEVYAVRVDKVKNISYSESTRLERCFMMLMETNREKLTKISQGDEMLGSVKEVLESMSQDENLIGVYYKEEAEWKEFVTAVRHEYNAGMQKGMQKQQLEIVKNMIEQNADVSFISKVTGLNPQKIKKLYKNYSKNQTSITV